MKKIIDFIKNYKSYILGILLLFFFFKSCGKTGEIKNLSKQVYDQEKIIDSLTQKLDSVPEIIRVEKINIHFEYDEWISSRDRGEQLMELHRVVKNNIKLLQK